MSDLTLMETSKEVHRIPRMRRLAYLRALLSSARGQEFTRDEARESILRVVWGLDADKAAALGRKTPKLPKGEQLLEQCVQMATRLGLVERVPVALRVTDLGEEVVRRGERGDLAILFQLLWGTFPQFREVVAAICASGSSFVLPVSRYEGRFDEAARKERLHVDHMTFEVSRDLATDLLLINWRPVFEDDGEYQKVYAAGTLSTTETRKTECADPPIQLPNAGRHIPAGGYVAPMYVASEGSGCRVFTGRSVDIEAFERILWRVYLRATGGVPRFPVLYPELRDAVCEELRITDLHFDVSLRTLIGNPRRLDIYPAEGLLDYSAKAAITYKQVPPRTGAGQFMTFLKLDRREGWGCG